MAAEEGEVVEGPAVHLGGGIQDTAVHLRIQPIVYYLYVVNSDGVSTVS